MFENGANDSRFLGVMVRLIPTYGAGAVVATVAVVTSSPPFAEGGHLVMARELVRALREEGHETGLIVTPQNRFGRQGSAYLAAWCTDVELAHEEKKVDQVISLRFPGYAVQHPNHVLWLNHRMREYYDLWDQFSSHLTWKGRIKEGVRRALIHRVDKHLMQQDAAALRDLGDGAGAAAALRADSVRRAVSAAAEARLSPRRLRRLPVRRVAAVAAQALRPRVAGARRADRRGHPVRHRR